MKLKDCCTIIAGQSPLSQFYNTSGDGIPFFQGKADFGAVYPSIRVYCTKPIRMAEKDDILLSVRAPVGPTNLSPCRACIGRGLTAIRPSDVLLTRYVLLFFRYFESQLSSMGTGTTFKAVTQDIIKNLDIPVPSLSVQNEIVSKIEELFSELDKAVETLKTVKEQLAVYRQAVLEECFSACSKIVEIKEVCTHVTDGDHLPPPKAQTGIPFIMISNIKNHIIDWSGTNYVSEDYYNKIGDKRTPRKGDVLYTVTGSFGIPVIVDFDTKFCFQRHIALLRPNNYIDSSFLFYALQTPAVFAQASKRATGTAQKTVGLSVLRTLKIPFVDSIDKQRNIVGRVEEKMEVCDEIDQAVDAALCQAKAMRQSILKKAFEGRL